MKELDEYFELMVEKPLDAKIQIIESIKSRISSLQESMPETLQTFSMYMESLEKLKNELNQVTYHMASEDFSTLITEVIQIENEDLDTVYDQKFNELMAEINDIVSQVEERNKQYNQGLYNQVNQENAIFNELNSKYSKLQEYRNQVVDLCARYGISSESIDIDETTLEPERLSKLYDEYLKYLKTSKEIVNPITVLREKVDNVLVQGGIVLAVFVLCFFWPLTIVSLAFVGWSILQALLFNINPNNLAHAEVDKSLLLPEEIPEEEWDTLEELSGMEEKLDEIEKEYNPLVKYADEHSAYMAEYESKKSEYAKRINECNGKFDETKSYVLKLWDELKRSADARYQQLRSKYEDYGHTFSENMIFNTKLTFGVENFIEEYVDIGENNVIIRPGTDESLLDSFIRCLLINAITHVHYTKMCIYVVDPNNMGRSVMPLYRADLDTKFKIVQSDVSSVLSTYTEEAQKNYQLMQGQTITQYNEQCLANGRDTLDYTLLLILSQPSDLEDKENLNALFKYSATAGIFMWVVSDSMPADEHTYTFLAPFQGIKHPLRLQDDREWCKSVSSQWHKLIDDYRPPALTHQRFIDVACPEGKEWSFNCDDDLYMYPGFQNGDPDYCIGYPLGNGGNVHALGVGTTGAGKSIFLNHIITTICTMYSPRDLQLWLCDFKGTEFTFFMSAPEHPNVLPHIKACLCTTDGDYATSVFTAVRNEVDKRFEQMKNPNDHRDWLKYDDGESVPNFENAKNWNIYWRNKAKDTNNEEYLNNCYPRIILLCDEFQAIFEALKDLPKNQEKVASDMTQISKLGRAANTNMFFTSQSMKGTLSTDIQNQFSLMFALRCTEDVAQDIMGSPLAARLPRFGNLYVSATGIKKEEQPKFKTPGIEKPEIISITNKLAKMAEEQKIQPYDVITYNESEKHDISELDKFYNEHQDILPDNGTLMVVGPRMTYSENKAPDNFIITKKNNENMLICMNDYSDIVCMFNSIMCNIRHNKGDHIIFINSQIEELTYLTKAEDYVSDKERLLPYLNASCKDTVTYLKNLVGAREKSGKDTPFWAFLFGWDKGVGFGVDTDLNLRTGMTSILQRAGVFNVHIIMINLSTTGIAQSIVTNSKYCMAGKCSIDDSMTMIGGKQAGLSYSLRNGWVFIKRDGVITRDKIYASKIDREILPNEVVL